MPGMIGGREAGEEGFEYAGEEAVFVSGHFGRPLWCETCSQME